MNKGFFVLIKRIAAVLGPIVRFIGEGINVEKMLVREVSDRANVEAGADVQQHNFVVIVSPYYFVSITFQQSKIDTTQIWGPKP
jgi:hypothetical protein